MNRFGWTLTAVGGGLLLALGGCSPPTPHPIGDSGGPLKTISSLDCPETQGDLTRKSAENTVCVYGDDNGSVATLRLVSLDGKDVRGVVAPMEDALRGELPPSADETGKSGPASADKGQVDIDLPGIHIHAKGDDKDKDGKANVIIGDGDGHDGPSGVSINAGDKGAEIHVGDSAHGVREIFVLTSDSPGPNGFKFVALEARGPQSGPIVVASIKAKAGDHDDLEEDLRTLLRHNVGG